MRRIPITDPTKTYYFGVATFDNAQVRHNFESGVTGLKFASAAPPPPQPAGALPKTGENLPIIAIGIAGLIALGLGWTTRRFIASRR